MENISTLLPIPGTHNTRDFGGMVTVSGKRIKKGCILRSASLDTITKEGKFLLQNGYNLKEIIDLRSEPEAAFFPDLPIEGVNHQHLALRDEVSEFAKQPYPHPDIDFGSAHLKRLHNFLYMYSPDGIADETMCQNYRNMISEDFPLNSWRLFFETLINADGAVLFHCRDGKDRTGVAAMLILSALGVDRVSIEEDYISSKRYIQEKIQERKDILDARVPPIDPKVSEQLLSLVDVHLVWLRSAMDEVERHGGILKYLEEDVGLGKGFVDRLRERFLED